MSESSGLEAIFDRQLSALRRFQVLVQFVNRFVRAKADATDLCHLSRAADPPSI